MSLELWHTCAPTHPQTQQTKIKRTFEKYNSHIYLRNILLLLTVAMNKQHQQALVPLLRLSYLYIEPALLQGKTMAMEGEEEEEEEKKSSSDGSTRGAPVNLPHCLCPQETRPCCDLQACLPGLHFSLPSLYIPS